MSDAPDNVLSYADRLDSATMPAWRRMVRGGRRVLTIAGAVILVLAVGGGIGAIAVRGVALVLPAFLLTAFVVLAIASGFRGYRANRARAVLTYVDRAVRARLPLDLFLAAAARAERGRLRRRLSALARSLAGGARLGDALRNEVPELPLRDAGLVRAADTNGTLAPTLARLAADVEPHPAAEVRRGFPWLYAGMMCFALPGAATMLYVFVAPKWAQIFHDFGMPPPAILTFARGRDATVITSFLLGVVVSAVIVVGLIATSFRWILFGRHDIDELHIGWLDRLRWRAPVLGAIQRDRDHADLCQTLGDGVAAHRPLDVAMLEAATLRVNTVLLDRLRTWRILLVSGQPLGTAARRAGFPRLMADLVGNAPDALGTSAALWFCARFYRSRADRRVRWLSAAAMPALTLAFGLAVALLARGMFEAIAGLIDATIPKQLGG